MISGVLFLPQKSSMPELKAGDMVSVAAAQFEKHLRATRVTKLPAAKPTGEKKIPDPSSAPKPPEKN
jgi:hypothetical protein